MTELKQQLASIENELQAERQKGAEADHGKVIRLQREYQDTVNQINAESQQQIEDKVHNDGIPFAIEGVDFKELPASLITLIEKVVKADRRRSYGEHAIEIEQLEEEARKNGRLIEALRSDLETLAREYATCERELQERTAETLRVIAERDEMKRNRDNAAAQLAEANAEIERLKSEIDDYQKAKAYGEREAQNIIDVTPDDADAINDAIKQFLTAEDWGSVIKVTKPDGSFENIKRAEFEKDWQPLEAPPIEIGDSASDNSFRIEDTEADAQNITIPAAEEVETVGSQFQTPDAGNELAGDTAVSEGNVTREEFEALKERVAKLEKGTVGEAA